MGIHDRDYGRRGGGSGGVLNRVFGGGDNPLGWAIPLYTLFGIRVRLSIFFVAMIVMYGLTGLRNGDLLFTLLPIGFVFLLVLLHEYGHCFACRAVGGEADDILLWPLGGLASCRPPHGWYPSLITTAGGPAVNLAILPLTLAALTVVSGGWHPDFRIGLFEALNPFARDFFGTAYIDGEASPGATMLLRVHAINYMLLLFNVLVPMFPMDGGRLMHAIMWRSMGFGRAMRITVNVGLGAAGVLVVAGLVLPEITLAVIGVFGGMSCWSMRRQLEVAGPVGFEEPVHAAAVKRSRASVAESTRQARRVAEEQARQRAEQDELDRVLDKIKQHGMQSINRRERQILERASKARRGG